MLVRRFFQCFLGCFMSGIEKVSRLEYFVQPNPFTGDGSLRFAASWLRIGKKTSRTGVGWLVLEKRRSCLEIA